MLRAEKGFEALGMVDGAAAALGGDGTRGRSHKKHAQAVAPGWTLERAATLLARGYWFRTLPAEMQTRIIAECEIVQVKRGKSLYRAGDPVDGVYAALEGDLRAYVADNSHQLVFLRVMGPATWFGEPYLLSEYPARTFEVVAKTACTVLFLPKARWQALTDGDLAIYKAFVKLTCIHSEHQTHVLIESRSEAPVRTAHALLRLARAHGRSTGRGVEIVMRLSQADLASLVGVSRQYINELITRWRKEGILDWTSGRCRILSEPRLKAKLRP
jgi:CRP/FNR family transcriptional regulator, cyclic AMP receptor protein